MNDIDTLIERKNCSSKLILQISLTLYHLNTFHSLAHSLTYIWYSIDIDDLKIVERVAAVCII